MIPPRDPDATREQEAERLARIIRKVDGDHSLGAGALAEAILATPSAAPSVPPELRGPGASKALARAMSSDTVRAIAIVESSRLTHVHWAEWRRTHPEGDDMAGDLAHHEQAIRDYDHVLAVLAVAPASGLREALPPADFPQVDHPWAGSEDGHDCATCIALEPADAPLANPYKCDRLAHVISDVNQAMSEHHKQVATENLRRYGGAAGPGLLPPPGAALAPPAPVALDRLRARLEGALRSTDEVRKIGIRDAIEFVDEEISYAQAQQ